MEGVHCNLLKTPCVVWRRTRTPFGSAVNASSPWPGVVGVRHGPNIPVADWSLSSRRMEPSVTTLPFLSSTTRNSLTARATQRAPAGWWASEFTYYSLMFPCKGKQNSSLVFIVVCKTTTIYSIYVYVCSLFVYAAEPRTEPFQWAVPDAGGTGWVWRFPGATWLLKVLKPLVCALSSASPSISGHVPTLSYIIVDSHSNQIRGTGLLTYCCSHTAAHIHSIYLIPIVCLV